MSLPDPERTRRHIGLGLYILGMMLGFLQLIVWFDIDPVKVRTLNAGKCITPRAKSAG